MTPPGVRLSLLSLALGGLVGVASCYGVPPWEDGYRCSEVEPCGPGLACDDGVCCRPFGQPACRTLVLDGGVCASGGAPRMYYEDLDGDGYGNEATGKLLCALPVLHPHVAQAGDCNDNPENGRLFLPGAEEICDGLDNDCDGQFDEGFPLKTFYEDQDFDGFGDPTRARALCLAPPGFVASAGDCGPNDPQVHPGAKERCNGADDDCDGLADNNSPEGTGDPCEVRGAQGVCRDGRTACVGGALACQSILGPSRDLCDGLDNDCDGQTDERPDCGGPADLLASDADLSWGAQNVGQGLNGGIALGSCVKGVAGSSPEPFVNPSWSGTNSNSHVFWVASNKGWDLTRPGTKLRLKFNHQLIRAASPPWAEHGQPVILLCGAEDLSTEYVRYVHFDGGVSAPVMSGANGAVDTAIPLAGSAEWVKGTATNDLTRVRRLEVLIQPWRNADGGVPTFSIDWLSGFGFEP